MYYVDTENRAMVFLFLQEYRFSYEFPTTKSAAASAIGTKREELGGQVTSTVPCPWINPQVCLSEHDFLGSGVYSALALRA